MPSKMTAEQLALWWAIQQSAEARKPVSLA